MPGLERWVLHRLAELDVLVRQAYIAYDFKAAFHALNNFCVVELSSIYFDIRKDRLYCDAPSWVERRACRTVMDEVFKRLVTWFAPIMPFTCEEAWEQRHPGKPSVHLELFPETPERWLDDALGHKWQRVFAVRSVVTGALEAMRRDKIIGSSLEASLTLCVPDHGVLEALSDEDPAEIFITSHVEPVVVQNLPSGEAAHVITSRVPPHWIKCARSWRYFDPATADPAFPDISPRDARAVHEYRGQL
jgi:isoleucyl-tRNA synthetase